MSVLLLVVGLVLFIGLIVIHEWGHFLAARRGGVEVEEFAIFFPPRLYRHKTRAGWTFSFNALPLGGFVKLKGEHDSDTEPGSFGAASLWVKIKIMVAGVGMNIVAGLLLLTVSAAIGLPRLVPNQFTVKSDTHTHTYTTDTANLVDKVTANSPAQKAGLKAGDRLVAIGPAGHVQKLANPDDLPTVTKRYAGQTVQVQVIRSIRHKDTQLTLTATLLSAKQAAATAQKASLGIETTPEFGQVTLQRSTWSAPVVAVGLASQLTVLTLQGLWHALAGLSQLIAGLATANNVARQHGQAVATSQVGGPVAIFRVMKSASLLGYQFMLFIIAYISLVLGIMNILPIPALDGGRLWIMLISRWLKRPLSAKREEAINFAGIVVLMALMVLVTINDIHHL